MKFLSLLAILFIGLKLANVITWSWLVVLSPLIAIPIIFFGFLFLAAWVSTKN